MNVCILERTLFTREQIIDFFWLIIIEVYSG